MHYANEQQNELTVGNTFLEAVISLDGTPRLIGLLNKITGDRLLFEGGKECALRLATGNRRIYIPSWRFHPGSGDDVPNEEDAGFTAGFHLPETDTSAWNRAFFLNEWRIGTPGYSTVVYPGYAWYRQSVILPSESLGEQIEFTLGGCDDKDWNEYWVYVNGILIGHSTPSGNCHPAPKYTLNFGDDAYSALRFGEFNLIAVQAKGLDRRFPGMSIPDAERYTIVSELADQYITIRGAAYREVSEFRLTDHKVISDADRSIVEMNMVNDQEGISISSRYWVHGDEPAVHKQLVVQNIGDMEHTLLEIDLQMLTGNFEASGGGMGFPCYIGDQVFCGVRHPAGVSQADENEVTLTSYPGKRIPPGGSYESKVAVLGVGPEGKAGQSFVEYLTKHICRKTQLLKMYHCYGIQDVAGQDRSYLTEEIVLSNLDDIANMQENGVDFDYYFIDAGWSNPEGDLKDFHPQCFPDGPMRIAERIKGLGLKLGLWTSPGAGPMAFYDSPLSRPQLAPCCGAGEVLCMASEPWRTMYRDALLYHVRETGVTGFKLDGYSIFCNNPDHSHLPGKYSCETIVDATIEILEEVRRECPDVFFMFYWGIRSPWWLLHGDTMFERGLLMEGATPADAPTKLLRQSVSLSFDQATHHAWDKIPLRAGDSLGVWVSNNRRSSFMGKEGWQDAWVMEIARGNMMSQIWGDLSNFDADDLHFMAQMSLWLKDNSHMLHDPKQILGDPWKPEPYGYSYFRGDTGAVFIYNPTFEQRNVSLQISNLLGNTPARNGGSYNLNYVYPSAQGGSMLNPWPLHADDKIDLCLDPFAVNMLQISDGSVDPPLGELVCPERPKAISLPCSFREVSIYELNWEDNEAVPFIRDVVHGRISPYEHKELLWEGIPANSDERDGKVVRRVIGGNTPIEPSPEGTSLLIACRLSRDGIFWHHHAMHEIIFVRAAFKGDILPVKSLPYRWHEQAGAWCWILFELPLPQISEPTDINVEILAYTPESVDVEIKTWHWRETSGSRL